jgi:hypothetical protein
MLVLWVAFACVMRDFMIDPIDRLYFQNPWRPLVGIRNTLIDILFGDIGDEYTYRRLWMVHTEWNTIRNAFVIGEPMAKKCYFHDMDEWFDHSENYYYYKVDDFPAVKNLLDEIPSVDTSTAVFSVIDGPMTIPVHRAESNLQLRYHLTLEGDGDCILHLADGRSHKHVTGEHILFDHSKSHSLVKFGTGRRVVLILDVNRF